MLITSSLAIPQKDGIRAGLVAVTVALLILLMDVYLQTWQIPPPNLLVNYMLGVVVFLLVVYTILVGILFSDYSLRGKITIAVFSTAIISILVVTAIYNQTYRVTLINAANQTLLLASERTASEIDLYLNRLIPGVEELASDPATSIYLNIPSEERQEVDNSIEYFREARQQIGAIDLILLDRRGDVALHTSYTNVDQLPNYLGLGTIERQSIDISVMTELPYISSIIFPTPEQAQYQTAPYFLIGKQVLNVEGNPSGIILAAFPQNGIQEVVEANNNLVGEQSYGVLVDDKYMRIASGAYPELINKLVISLNEDLVNQLEQNQQLPSHSGESLTTDYEEFAKGLDSIPYTPYFETRDTSIEEYNAAAGVRLGLKNWILVYMLPRWIILQPVEQQTRDVFLITALISGLAVVISALLARFISNPVTQLTQAAERASSGDLTLRAPAASSDEIGKMGLAFNVMIDQLQRTLQGLEERVKERTAELTQSTEQLEYRASRLQMVAEVAEALAAASDPNDLLTLVVNTISERFGFYHVGVFMVDPYNEYAVLVAANSEGGLRMLARGHRLRVGQEGMVGYVTGRGQARIALDVGQDIVFFNNPDLPETRSEITLPLKIGDNLFGALDVQSTMPKAFDASDIALLSTLANQVAIAIENTRLIDEAQRSVRELELSQRLFIQQEWNKLLEQHTPEGFKYILGKLVPLSSKDVVDGAVIPKAPTVIFENPNGNGDENGSGLMVPITLRGETIGLIELGETTNTRRWSKDEISLVSSIAEQVGLALEYARLLETTRRRAERERLLSEITTRLRSTNDPQQILETAVTQLKHALRVQSVKVHVVSKASDSENDTNNGSSEDDQQDPTS